MSLGSGNKERVSIFIDGANLAAACKSIHKSLDFGKVKLFFENSRTYVVDMRYYTAFDPSDDEAPMHKLVTWLGYNGFSMVTKEVKKYTQSNGTVRLKGNMDVEFTLDVFRLSKHVDRVVLFTGDGDFTALVEEVKREGKRVTIVSTMRGNIPIVSGDLRKAANDYIDLVDMVGCLKDRKFERT